MYSKATAADIFWGMFSSAVIFFRRHVDAINSLNVFPVPDGDTGTNMYGTLEGIQSRMRTVEYADLRELTDLLSQAALYEGRGNSGIILSQIFRGLAEYLSVHTSEVDLEIISGAIGNARVKAFDSVAEPTEGTMLTVLSDVANRADSLKGKEISVKNLFKLLVEEAQRSVDRTPELLPILKDSGVVDSGGYGIEVILEGMAIFLTDTDPATVPIMLRRPAGDGTGVENLISDHFGSEDEFGYCTQFILDTDQESETIGTLFQALGTSTVIIGEMPTYRIHIHATDPGAVLTKAVELGSIASVSVENMEVQSKERLGSSERTNKASKIDLRGQTALISIVNGSGISEITRNLGVDLVIDGGVDMNPSVADIVSAVDRVEADSILLLTNDKNVIPAADQAAELVISNIVILPTETQAEGLECIVDFDPYESAFKNKEMMVNLIPLIKTITIFKSSRAVEMNGQKVDHMQPIAMINGELYGYAENVDDLFVKVVEEELEKSVEHITVLLGNGLTNEDVPRLEKLLKTNLPDLSEDIIEVHVGDQPHYDYLISVLQN
ncbi:MAG: DAK2 domain-containing protein [SAR202 cluster bacterium]|nr:MAG: DAK2 domain-containing protein [SAR202 cluster bacterium]